MPIEAPFLKSMSVRGAPDRQEYPFNIPIVENGVDLEFNRSVTIICGENGTGKSTLIELIAAHCGFSITGGNRNHRGADEESDVAVLLNYAKFSWSLKISTGFFMRAESFFEFSRQIDRLARESGSDIYLGYGGKSLHAQSHGESFISLFANRMSRRGIYLLDEPEAALSPQRQLAFLGLLDDLVKTGQQQFVIATHSPLLMSYPDATLLVLENGEFVERNVRTTPHFQILARFFADPEDYIRKFLG